MSKSAKVLQINSWLDAHYHVFEKSVITSLRKPGCFVCPQADPVAYAMQSLVFAGVFFLVENSLMAESISLHHAPGLINPKARRRTSIMA